MKRIKGDRFKVWFYGLPLWVRWFSVYVLNVAPWCEPLTREQEIRMDYLAAKHNHS